MILGNNQLRGSQNRDQVQPGRKICVQPAKSKMIIAVLIMLHPVLRYDWLESVSAKQGDSPFESTPAHILIGLLVSKYTRTVLNRESNGLFKPRRQTIPELYATAHCDMKDY